MVRTESKKLLELDFKNVSDFTRYIDSNKHLPSTNGIVDGTGGWTGIDTWKDYEDYLENGNPAITADVRKHSKYYIDKFEDMFSTVTNYQFDVVGEFFDIGAVMVGEPEAWIKEIQVGDDKFIELTIQGSYQDGTDLGMVRENGSKVFAIATVLEQQGFLVRINMVYSSIGSNTDNSSLVTEAKVIVKDYDSGLDYKKFGILLGVPMFRRGFLRLLEIEHGHDISSGFGRAYKIDGQINLDSVKDIANLENTLKKDK